MANWHPRGQSGADTLLADFAAYLGLAIALTIDGTPGLEIPSEQPEQEVPSESVAQISEVTI